MLQAHIRRIETYIESWISQQQQSRTYVKSAVNEREQGGVNDGAWQAAVKRRQLQHGNTTPFVRAQPGRVNDGARGGKHDRERGRGGADAVSGFCSEDLRVVDGDGWDLGLFSRSCRKQWSTAVFQVRNLWAHWKRVHSPGHEMMREERMSKWTNMGVRMNLIVGGQCCADLVDETPEADEAWP